MKRFLISIFLVFVLAIPVSSMDFTAPEVPDAAKEYVEENTESFLDGLLFLFQKAIEAISPSVPQAAEICLAVIGVSIITAMIGLVPSSSKFIQNIVKALTISCILIGPTNTFIELGVSTVNELSQYGKLLLPVMTAALAAQGATTSASAIYGATVIFDNLLCAWITKLMVPMLYCYLCLSIVQCISACEPLLQIRSFIKWAMTWVLKISLYVFTGFLSISGVVSGTIDSSAIKAAKIVITGAVPVVGSIVSDASEAILVSAGVMKNAAGLYGVLALIALFLVPFLTIAVQHIFLKVTAGICGILDAKNCLGLIEDFSSVMGYLLAMTGSICLLHLISTVCFLKGMS